MSARADRFRQRHLGPMTWEGPVLAALLLLTVAAAVPLAVQAVAGLVVSGHWAWPSGHLVDAIAARDPAAAEAAMDEHLRVVERLYWGDPA